MSHTGVVLLHGKWDTPPFAVAPLRDALVAAGYPACMPSFPWALRHLYDAPLSEAFDTVTTQIDTLLAAGCDRIVLGGHSLGAAVALAYAARHSRVDALLVMAPGHFPERLAALEYTTAALERARAAPDADARQPLVDVHQGQVRRLRIAPRHYLGYFDPAGALVWPANAARLTRALPMLWRVGREDAAAELGIDYAFARAPAHPNSAYVLIDADHASTPRVDIPGIIDWLASIER